MIYLDNAATTMPYEKAIKSAEQFNTQNYFNPSALYLQGIETSKQLKSVKDKILNFVGLSSTDYQVIFTSCGSESNNTAIFCSVKRGVFVTDLGQHASVYNCFQELKTRGNEVVYVDLNSDGSINQEDLINKITAKKPDFVSLIHVNNETGAINDVNQLAKIIKRINPKTVIHCDGVQAFGKLPYKLSNIIDFYSISAHKINALKGLGVLIRKKQTKLTPLIFGGGQEYGLRSGTENVFGIKVFESAMDSHFENLLTSFDKVKTIKNTIINALDKDLFKIISSDNSSPYILSISALGLKGEILMHLLEEDGIIVGNGSACSSKHPYSRVISSCGYNHDVLNGVVRLSFCPENTIEQANFVAERLNYHANNLKGKIK